MADPLSPDVLDHLALALVPGLGPRLTAALLERFGSAAAARRATAAELREIPHVGAKTADTLAAALQNIDLDAELRLLGRCGVRPVPLGYPGYPPPLAGLASAPPLLYFRGDWTDADAAAVGVVGSRSCTAYGKRVTEGIARGLVRAGFTVVSGLARGIDGVAHRAALDAGGRTVAVLAGGLSAIYPPEHADLANEVAGRGCLVSESPMAAEPLPGMFHARNRIISGLSRAVVVVEANARSGALITARHALEQGREVFAVPGPVDSPASAGCLLLVRNGARLVRSADDILEDLKGIAAPDYSGQETGNRRQGPGDTGQKTGPKQPDLFGAGSEVVPVSGPVAPEPALPPNLDPAYQQVWDALASRRHADELARELELPVAKLSTVLMGLEMRKLVRRLPGNFYERR
jgi:DNA processing protein